ncbi:hypothetical protein GGX14DRAFT_348202 [Mycena pura]|uniref:DNA binding protein Ncp1 n=1 Tax=Mycena pura TaxID=153505 RepID=A0AAD6YRQ0_9AGAR|nr:hypothetical protein GGX14DRAFT_348202 [Mycena pura]
MSSTSPSAEIALVPNVEPPAGETREAKPAAEPAREAPPALAKEISPPTAAVEPFAADLSTVTENEAERAESDDVVADPNGVLERSSLPGSTLSPNSHRRGASITSTTSISRRSVFTNVDGRTVAGSTFTNGAGTTGPNAIAEDESLHQRAASAEATLSEDQKAKLARSGSKNNKKLAKVIKSEAKVEKKALSVAIHELSELQKMQKTAVKREEKSQTLYNKTLSQFQKHEAIFFAARSKYEASQALLTVNTEALEVSRNSAKETTASMQEKSQEVDGLRKMFEVDEKEREVKLVELTGKGSVRSWWSIMG